jgi:hypothetical protein
VCNGCSRRMYEYCPLVFTAGRFSTVRGWTDDQKFVMSRREIYPYKGYRWIVIL